MQMASTPPSILCCEERRYPYLDRELVEFLASIPAEQLLRPGERRSLMRRALAHLVPKEILERKTKQVSVRRYMVALDSHWRDIETLLGSSLVAGREVADSQLLWQALHAARNGHAPQLIRLLRILAVELWLRDMRDRRIVRDTDMTPLHAATIGSKAVA
jgi:asparagine synthase (glutamine-hydrolysing)